MTLNAPIKTRVEMSRPPRHQFDSWSGLKSERVSGAWYEGDPIGRRNWYSIEAPLELEACGQLPQAQLAYETWGNLSPDASNAVLVLHSLTDDSHVAGSVEPGHATPGWWDALVGPDRPLDPAHWFIVAPNALGGCQGSTGPSSIAPDGHHWGSRFPFLTIRDQVNAEAVLTDALGIDSWAAVIGPSMGGMRALEWAITYPDRVRALCIVAAPAATAADQIAWTYPQLAAIYNDPGWRGGDYYTSPPGSGPDRGLAIARSIAHVVYRAEDLCSRFGRDPQGIEQPPWRGGRYAIESYLDYNGQKLTNRYDAGSYVVLNRAMNCHDVGRNRGGTRAALARITAATKVLGIDTDRLYPLWQQQELVTSISGCSGLDVIRSPYGHDGFLIEARQISVHLRELLPVPN